MSVQVKQFGPFPTIEQTDLSSGEWYWKAADGAIKKFFPLMDRNIFLPVYGYFLIYFLSIRLELPLAFKFNLSE